MPSFLAVVKIGGLTYHLWHVNTPVQWNICYHSEAAQDRGQEKDEVAVDLLVSLQQDVEEFNEAKGSQEETQQL